MILSRIPEFKGALPANVQVQIRWCHLFSSHLRAWSSPKQPQRSPCQLADVGLTLEGDCSIEGNFNDSVWFVQFLTISVQINSLRSQTMSQSVNRWRCGVHTHPWRSLQVMCHPVVLTPQTRWVGPATHIHHSVSSVPEELVLFWHARSEWRFGLSLASNEFYSAQWYWWCIQGQVQHYHLVNKSLQRLLKMKNNKLTILTILLPNGSFFNGSWQWSNWRD